MGILELFNAVTATDCCDDEKDLTNFIHALKYVDNFHNYVIIYNYLSSSAAIPDFDILPSFKSELLFSDTDEYERSLHKLNIRPSSSTGDVISIANKLTKINGINKLCQEIKTNDDTIIFILK